MNLHSVVFVLRSFIYLYIYEYSACLYVCMCNTCCLERSEEGTGSWGSGVTGVCDLPSVGVRNQTGVLGERRERQREKHTHTQTHTHTHRVCVCVCVCVCEREREREGKRELCVCVQRSGVSIRCLPLYRSCPGLVFISMISTKAKIPLWKKGLIGFTVLGNNPSLRAVKAGAWTGICSTDHGEMLFTGLLSKACSGCFFLKFSPRPLA